MAPARGANRRTEADRPVEPARHDSHWYAQPSRPCPQRVDRERAEAHRCPGNHVLQRLAVRESDQVRSGEPCGEEFWISLLDLLVAPQLPCAIINIVEFIDDLGFHL